MISNRRTRGLEIWAQSPSDEAFALAAEMEPFLDEDSKNQAFIIVGNQLPNEDLVALANKHGVIETTVCIPNSKKLFQQAEFSEDCDLYVFFLDRKQVIARHDLQASELTPESRRELAKEIGAFLRSAR